MFNKRLITGALLATTLSGCNSPATVLYGRILNDTHQFVHDIYMPMATAFEGIANHLILVFLVMIGWAWMTNKPKPFLMNFAIAAIAFAMVSTSTYFEWIYTPLTDGAKRLAEFPLQVALHSGSSGIFTIMEDSILGIDNRMGKLLEGKGILDLDFYGIWLTYGALIILCCAQYFFYLAHLLVGLVAMSVLLSIGGVMVLFGATPITRHIFFAWLRQVFTFGLIPTFASLVMALTISVTIRAMDAMTKIPIEDRLVTGEMLYAAIVTLIGLLLLKRTPEWAAAITGTTASSLSGLLAAAGGLAGGVMLGWQNMKQDARKSKSPLGGYGSSALTGALEGFRNPGEGMSKPYSAMLGIGAGIRETYSKRQKKEG